MDKCIWSDQSETRRRDTVWWCCWWLAHLFCEATDDDDDDQFNCDLCDLIIHSWALHENRYKYHSIYLEGIKVWNDDDEQ